MRVPHVLASENKTTLWTLIHGYVPGNYDAELQLMAKPASLSQDALDEVNSMDPRSTPYFWPR